LLLLLHQSCMSVNAAYYGALHPRAVAGHRRRSISEEVTLPGVQVPSIAATFIRLVGYEWSESRF